MKREEARKLAEKLVGEMTLEEKASSFGMTPRPFPGWEFRPITGGTKPFTG